MRRVGPRHAEALSRLGILTVEDLLLHYPSRYEDRRQVSTIGSANLGAPAVFRLVVREVTCETTRRRHMQLVRVHVTDSTGSAEMIFFNQPWLQSRLNSLRGHEIIVSGPILMGDRGPLFESPEWEPAAGPDSHLHVDRIVPVHAATQGLTPRQIRAMIWQGLEAYADQLIDLLPPALLARRGLCKYRRAVHSIHFPSSLEELETARRRLVYEELFRMQAVLAMRRCELTGDLPGLAHGPIESALDELRTHLPFSLTAAQERVIREIGADMAARRPMNRLLQGDVGSGKTIVAAAAVVAAVRSGFQVAIMAPTEILADQHFTIFQDLLDRLNIRVHRLMGSVRAKGKRIIKEDLKTGFVPVVVGTHALLQSDVEFRNLGLVIVDEQHRFGVLQRLALLDKGMVEHVPDMLVMTATPIPRSLALTIYGDLEVSVIDEMPPGRLPVRTHWRRKEQRERVLQGVRKLVEQGRQVYYLCPLVEQSERMQARAATAVYEELTAGAFSDLRMGLIHGQMKPHEKDDVMQRFRRGGIDVLVATVVIEVGVDVPNACCMVIEDAERFGLSQLHQLRGRVGRGAEQSFCVLLADPTTNDGAERLKILTETTDGFRIAEEDLRLRGPGEFLGTRQSGIFRLRIANIQDDEEILRQARQDACELIAADPELAAPAHTALGADLRRRYSDLLLVSAG